MNCDHWKVLVFFFLTCPKILGTGELLKRFRLKKKKKLGSWGHQLNPPPLRANSLVRLSHGVGQKNAACASNSSTVLFTGTWTTAVYAPQWRIRRKKPLTPSAARVRMA